MRERLARVVPELLPGDESVAGVRCLADDVWLVRLQNGGSVVAKHQLFGPLTDGAPHDLLQVELDVLRAVRAHGGPVPFAFGADRCAQLILLEYAGPRTLADALRAGTTAAQRHRWLAAVAAGLRCIEATLDDGSWHDRVAPGASRPDLRRRWEAVAPVAVAAATALTAGVEALVRSLHRRLGAVAPRLGAIDYQPANIVLGSGGQRLSFLELSKLGWDWTARRAVQYTSLADGEGGLLDPASVEALDVATPARADLDGHHLLYHLLVAGRVRESPDPVGLSPCLARALTQPLSDDPLVGDLRRRLGQSNAFRGSHP